MCFERDKTLWSDSASRTKIKGSYDLKKESEIVFRLVFEKKEGHHEKRKKYGQDSRQ